jgi:hypothetical protein
MMSGAAFLEGFTNGLLTQSQQRFENELQAQKLHLAQQQEQNQGNYLQALSKAATMRAQNAGDKTFKYLSALGAIETRLGKLRGDLQTAKQGLPDTQDPGRIARLQGEINQWDGISSLLFKKSMTGVLADEPGYGQEQGQGQQGGGGSFGGEQESPGEDQGEGSEESFAGGGAGEIPGGGESPAPGGAPAGPQGGAVPRGTQAGGRALPPALTPEQAKGLEGRTQDFQKYTNSQIGQTALESELYSRSIPVTVAPLEGEKFNSQGDKVATNEGSQFLNFAGKPITEADILKDPSILDDTLEAILSASPGYQNPEMLAMYQRDILNKVPMGVVTEAEAASNPTLAARRQVQAKAAEIRAWLGGQNQAEFQAQQQGREQLAQNPMVNAEKLVEQGGTFMGDLGRVGSEGASVVAKKLTQAVNQGSVDLTNPEVMKTLSSLSARAWPDQPGSEGTEWKALQEPLSRLGFGPGGFGSRAPVAPVGEELGNLGQGIQAMGRFAVGNGAPGAPTPSSGLPAMPGAPRAKAASPAGAGGANVQGMAARAALTAGAIGSGGKTPAAVLGSIGPATKDKEKTAQQAISDVRGMSKTDKATAREQWKTKRQTWLERGVDERTVNEMDRVVGYEPSGESEGAGSVPGGVPKRSAETEALLREAKAQGKAGGVGGAPRATAGSLGPMAGAALVSGAIRQGSPGSAFEGLKKIAEEEGPSRNQKIDRTLDQLDDQLKEHPEQKAELKTQWAKFRDENMDLTDRTVVREIDQRLGVDIAEPKTESEELFPGEKKSANDENFRDVVDRLAEPKKVQMSARGIRAYDLLKALGSAKGKMSEREQRANLSDMRDELQFLRTDQPQIVSLLARWRKLDDKLPSNEKRDFEAVGRTLFAFLER